MHCGSESAIKLARNPICHEIRDNKACGSRLSFHLGEDQSERCGSFINKNIKLGCSLTKDVSKNQLSNVLSKQGILNIYALA